MPEFVIQDVLSGEYQYNTHLYVIPINKDHPEKQKREIYLGFADAGLNKCTLLFFKIKSFKIVYLLSQMDCRIF